MSDNGQLKTSGYYFFYHIFLFIGSVVLPFSSLRFPSDSRSVLLCFRLLLSLFPCLLFSFPFCVPLSPCSLVLYFLFKSSIGGDPTFVMIVQTAVSCVKLKLNQGVTAFP